MAWGILALLVWMTNAPQAQAQPVLFGSLYSDTVPTQGNQPVSLCLGTNGVLYGVNYGGNGGLVGGGKIFRINRDGSGYTVIKAFTAIETGNSNAAADSVSAVEGADLSGQVPLTGGLTLTAGNDGNFYGTTYYGGTNGLGSVFSMTTAGQFTEIHSSASFDPNPVNVFQGNNGMLYGTTWAGIIFSMAPDGSGYTTYPLKGFGSYCPSLIQGSDGMLYGTWLFATFAGPSSEIFRLNTDTTGYTILTNLTTAGLESAPTIIQGSDGNLYFTSGFGSDRGLEQGVCRMDTNGTGLTVLHEFTAGNGPIGLVEGQSGILYGTTLKGGTNYGSLYEIGMDGSGYNILYNFESTNGYPMGALTAGTFPGDGGVLYGTTTATIPSIPYEGSVFSLTVNPPLSITPPTNGFVTVSWPAWALTFKLQSSTNLLSPTWVNLGGGLLELQNGVFVVESLERNTGPGTYYRLAYPIP